MSITPKELIHGAVLARIVRSGKRPTLQMIGTNLDENVSTYEINGEVFLHVVYRTPRRGWEFDEC